MTLPRNVADAIAAFKQYKESTEHLSGVHSKRADELTAQLGQKRAELDAASDAALSDPKPANIEKEAQLQREIAEMTAEQLAAEERASRVFHRTSGPATELARAAITTASAEARKLYMAEYDAKLQAIEDAKYAYLKSLVDLHGLGEEARAIFRAAVRETNPNLAEAGRSGAVQGPELPEPAVFYRQGGRQVWGVSEPEIVRAMRHGIIRPTDVAPGREV